MDEIKSYIKEIKNKFEFNEIILSLDKLKDLNVLVLGDTIIDHYAFVTQKGRAVKDPILSTKFENEEEYAGGIVVIANHISSFVNDVKLVTLLGDRDSKTGFIQNSLAKNVNIKIFVKENSTINHTY